MKPRWKKGMIMLQTLVMSVMVSAIAVMIMKWILGRYMLVMRNYRSTTSVTRVVGYSQKTFATWNFGAVPSSGNDVIDSQAVSFTTSGTGMKTVILTADEDQ